MTTTALREPLTGRHHPAVSARAASAARLNSIKQRARIETFVLACGTTGATSDEICLALNLGPQSVSARLLELRGEAKNCLAPAALTIARRLDGKAVTRPTGSGCAARVHVHAVLCGDAEQMNLFG